MLKELHAKYSIPKKIAQPWVDNVELLLLLDGLDEVDQAHREEFVRALNAFRQSHLVDLAVCSRIADYEVLRTQLKLQGAVLLQPLTAQQIDEYLSGAGVELLAVRKSLAQDDTLQELAQTPLTLSVMTLAYKDYSVQDLKRFETIEARRHHLFDAYVKSMFNRRGLERTYSKEKATRWLSWLAQQMFWYSQSVFLLESLQPDHLVSRVQLRWYRLIVGLFGGLSGCLIVGLFLGLFGGLYFGLEPEIEPIDVLNGRGQILEKC